MSASCSWVRKHRRRKPKKKKENPGKDAKNPKSVQGGKSETRNRNTTPSRPQLGKITGKKDHFSVGLQSNYAPERKSWGRWEARGTLPTARVIRKERQKGRLQPMTLYEKKTPPDGVGLMIGGKKAGSSSPQTHTL